MKERKWAYVYVREGAEQRRQSNEINSGKKKRRAATSFLYTRIKYLRVSRARSLRSASGSQIVLLRAYSVKINHKKTMK